MDHLAGPAGPSYTVEGADGAVKKCPPGRKDTHGAQLQVEPRVAENVLKISDI